MAASKPGILTEWPWKCLGNFKYMLLAPLAIHSTYSYMVKDEAERNLPSFIILPFLILRLLHGQIWNSLSRYQTAKWNRIVNMSIEFEHVDKQSNWDDQIILNGIIFYFGVSYIRGIDQLPWWRTDGVIWIMLLHAGPVEFLYYWLHRALHHHFLYSRYHSHHHTFIVTEAITAVIHPFLETTAYVTLFVIPVFTTIMMGSASILSITGYVMFIDFMNYMGHCNFDHIPKWLFSAFPPLKYFMYTPTFHALHHTQLRTNYTLFMPLYDYIYGTVDTYNDSVYANALARKEEEPDVVHLTHLTTPESIYHLHFGFAFFASQPQKPKWYFWLLMWPLSLSWMLFLWIFGGTFTVERNDFNHLKLQTWAITKYSFQYHMKWQRKSINGMIEDAMLEAEARGIKVLSLGLMNQGHGLNRNGELFIERNPKLKVKLVDGSSLAVAIVLNSIPKGTTQVVLHSLNLSKVACSIALALYQHGIQIIMMCENAYEKLKVKLGQEAGNNLVLSYHSASKIWLVGDDLSEDEQLKASKGTIFIPYSQFPPKEQRRDCFYSNIPAMLAPKHLQNLNSCENWLPRRVMSASRITGIIHAMEDWNVNECGDVMFDIEKIWKVTLDHGFRPLTTIMSA